MYVYLSCTTNRCVYYGLFNSSYFQDDLFWHVLPLAGLMVLPCFGWLNSFANRVINIFTQQRSIWDQNLFCVNKSGVSAAVTVHVMLVSSSFAPVSHLHIITLLLQFGAIFLLSDQLKDKCSYTGSERAWISLDNP